MRISRVVPAVAIAILLFALAGCASRGIDLTRSADQMDFGVRMARSNLWREALFRFERAVEIEPANAMAQNNLAVAYEGIGEFDKARDAYAEALRLDRSNQYIQKNYSRFVEFYSRNRRREQLLRENDEKSAATAPAEEEEERSEPVELSRPEQPPGPGELPVSDVPPDPTPPVPASPPVTDPPPPGGEL
ncbi:MAG TPA: tetratricopeptide repeat protein [Thermoanaerobaculia bacterium]|nr:tetratricopeptide repeat protein [Thermoanaerobaculia bacterium]